MKYEKLEVLCGLNNQYRYSIVLFRQLSQTVLVVRYSMKVSWSVSHIDIYDNFQGHSQCSNVNDRSNIIKSIQWNDSVDLTVYNSVYSTYEMIA